MPPALRIGDPTNHPGTVGGPGVPTVLIGGKPAAVVGTLHACAFPPPPSHPPTPMPLGSKTVTIGSRGALRVGDAAGCGAIASKGADTVMIGD
jgi:uncharacterized Zn-binding protein involved in type VI secretion